MKDIELDALARKVYALRYTKDSVEVAQYQLLKRRLRFTIRESFNTPGTFGDTRVIRKGFTKYLLDHFYNGSFYYRVRVTFVLAGSFEDFLKSIVIIDATETASHTGSRSTIQSPQSILSEILSLAKK